MGVYLIDLNEKRTFIMKKAENNLTRLLTTAKGNSTDIYYTVYEEYIKKSETPWRELQKIVEYAYEVGTDDKNAKRIAEERINDIVKKHGYILTHLVHYFVVENLPEEDFYKKLYNIVFASDIFPRDDEVQVVLLQLLAKNVPGLPYFPLHNVMKMTDDEFREASKKMLPQLRKGMSVLNRGLATNTEAISQLWPISQELQTDKEKIVFFSAIVGLAFGKQG